jgi:hypothetical protein
MDRRRKEKELESFRKAFDVTKVFAIKKTMVVLKGYIFNIQKMYLVLKANFVFTQFFLFKTFTRFS